MTQNDKPKVPAARCASPVSAAALAVIAAIAFAPRQAKADDTIRRPGDHPSYGVEVEPHVVFGWGGPYAPGGFGLGGRLSIPVVQNGFVPTINNSIAVSFGLDWVHYESCFYAGNCSADYFNVPVAMQWNFYVAQRWSVFGEPGAVLYFGSYPDCPLQASLCPTARPPTVGVVPALFLGGRYHLSDSTALTIRIGFPAFSLGFSFFL